MVTQFKLMFREDSQIITVSEAPMFNANEAEPATVPFLQLVRQSGSEYAKEGRVSEETMKKQSVPMIPDEEYAAICNGNKQV